MFACRKKVKKKVVSKAAAAASTISRAHQTARNLLSLSNSIDPAHCLQFIGPIEAGVDEDDVARLGEVEAIAGKVRRQQQHIDIGRALKGLNVARKVAAPGGMHQQRLDVVLLQ